MPFIALALLIAATFGGGVSLAANQTLPGDALYGFKIHVNENVGGAMSFGSEARTSFDISAVEKRLKEAEKLAAQGGLNADAQAKINSNFEAHAAAVQKGIAKLQQEGKHDAAANLSARFESILAAHASAMTEASAKGDTYVKAALNPLTTKVQATLSKTSAIFSGASTQNQNSSVGVGASTQAGVRTTDTAENATELDADGSVKVDIF